MKKLLLAVIGIVLFVSCGDKKAQEDVVGTDETRSQEQKSADLIVGNWAPTNWDITQTVDGEIVFETQGDKEIQYMFLSDGTGSVIQNFRLDGKDDLQTTGSFKWAASGDKVSLTDYKFISPPNMAFGTPEFVFETEWMVRELTDQTLKVSFTRTKWEHPGVQQHSIVVFERVK